MRRLLLVILLSVAVSACGSDASPTTSTTTPPSAPSSQVDLVIGTGATAAVGNTVTVNYLLWLDDPTQPEGKGMAIPQPPSTTFVLGAGSVIKGWDQGVVGMRVGGQRRLIIPLISRTEALATVRFRRTRPSCSTSR